MKLKKCSEMTSVFALMLCGLAHGETGNSLVFNDSANDRVIAIDRINLATLPAHERQAIIGDAEEQLGEGRVADLPGSYGGFAQYRQQDSSGSLTGKTLDIEFAPLEAEPELSQNRIPERGDMVMQKLDQAEGIYYVAQAGRWEQDYGGEAWREPSRQLFRKAWLTACLGEKIHEYNKSYGRRALWEWVGRVTRYNVTVGYEKDLKEVAVGGAKLKITAKGSYTSGTRSRYWQLWSDSYFWLEDWGYSPDGDRLYSYDETTSRLSTFIGFQAKLTYPLAALSASNSASIKLAEGGLNAIAVVNIGNYNSSEDGYRERQVYDFGFAEQSATASIQVEVGIELKVKVLNSEVSATCTLGYKYLYGIATGTRDFDYYCYDAAPQHYSHRGYQLHEVFFKRQTQLKILGRNISISQNRTLLSITVPGRFTSSDAPELMNTPVDYVM